MQGRGNSGRRFGDIRRPTRFHWKLTNGHPNKKLDKTANDHEGKHSTDHIHHIGISWIHCVKGGYYDPVGNGRSWCDPRVLYYSSTVQKPYHDPPDRRFYAVRTGYCMPGSQGNTGAIPVPKTLVY